MLLYDSLSIIHLIKTITLSIDNEMVFLYETKQSCMSSYAILKMLHLIINHAQKYILARKHVLHVINYLSITKEYFLRDLRDCIDTIIFSFLQSTTRLLNSLEMKFWPTLNVYSWIKQHTTEYNTDIFH